MQERDREIERKTETEKERERRLKFDDINEQKDEHGLLNRPIMKT